MNSVGELIIKINQKHTVSILKNFKKLKKKTNLSSNNLQEIEAISNLIQLKELDLSNNLIMDVKALEYLNNLVILNISYNPISLNNTFNYSYKFQKIYINSNQKNIFNGLKNNNIERMNDHILFLKAMNIITIDNVNYLNCEQVIFFSKYNINFNLFFPNQIDEFHSKCKSL